MLCAVVSGILYITCQEKVELPLGNYILYPMVPHVKSLRALHESLGCANVMGSGVVSLNGCKLPNSLRVSIMLTASC